MDGSGLMAAQALIVGAGPIGALLALALDQHGWQVTLLEKQPLAPHQLPSSYDERQLALTPQSVDWLKTLLPNAQFMEQLTPILRIHTSSKDQFGTMTMSAQEMRVPALGYTLSQHKLGQILFEALAHTKVHQHAGIELTTIDTHAHGVTLTGMDVHQQSHQWQATYCFAADGAHSWVRNQLGINAQVRPYNHQLMTCIAQLSQAHQHTAVERFTQTGPTALLPLADPYQAKLVYCYANDAANTIQNATEAALIEQINMQLGHQLGTVTALSNIQHYPLMEIRPDHLQHQQIMLVGNAAHTQHPVAGQGLNLGIRDVQTIAEWAKSHLAEQWPMIAQQRLDDHQRTMQATHGLVTLFSHPQPFVRGLASIGLQLLDTCPPLKKRITRMAMGY